MAVGQGPLRAVLDVPALNVLEGRLELAALDRCAAHGRRLRDVLALDRVLTAAGVEHGASAQLALLEQTSEQAAAMLLTQAQVLAGLPGGLEAVDCALLTVEQAAVVGRTLAPLTDLVRCGVWRLLQARLLGDLDAGVVLPPAVLGRLLAGWILQADADAAVARRKDAESFGSVDYRQRDDGLTDLFATGLTGPNAQAILSRIRDRARPWGAADDRSAGKRRLDAFCDLLLGRDQLPLGPVEDDDPFHHPDPPRCSGNPSSPGSPASPGRPGQAAPCGCLPGQPVPCGAGITLLVPLGAALGTTDELAILEGHGPLEPDLLGSHLQAAPSIRAAWVDPDGQPVAVGRTVERPPRADRQAVRDTLLRLAASTPEPAQPRHPDDHPHDHAAPEAGAAAAPPGPRAGQSGGNIGSGTIGAATTTTATPTAACEPASDDHPRVLQRPHPAGTPGRYRPPTRMARLIRARAPRCEWPGCGHRSNRCDLDHDTAWPYSPTCPCNLGPLCRRHHRLKQTLLTKQRQPGGVVWTSPTGRTWTSPNQHQPPAAQTRPVPPVQTGTPRHPTEPDDHSDDDDPDDEVPAHLDTLTTTPDPLQATPTKPEYDPDRAGWEHALDDHTRWNPQT